VHRDAAKLAAGCCNFVSVYTRANPKPVMCRPNTDRACTPKRSGRRIEHCHKSVASGVDDTSPKPLDLRSRNLVVGSEQLTPSDIANSGERRRRFDEVGERPTRVAAMPAKPASS